MTDTLERIERSKPLVSQFVAAVRSDFRIVEEMARAATAIVTREQPSSQDH